MGSPVIQLIILAGIAIFLILKLRSVLGTRDGFENSQAPKPDIPSEQGVEIDLGSSGVDRDIAEFIDPESESGQSLAEMKARDRKFSVASFMDGSRNAYELILIAFASGEVNSVAEYLSDDVYDSFQDTLSGREDLTYFAKFVGFREVTLEAAAYERRTHDAEITIAFVGELISYVKNSDGEIVEGDADAVRRQKDVWTFARDMSNRNPNWELVATGG